MTISEDNNPRDSSLGSFRSRHDREDLATITAVVTCLTKRTICCKPLVRDMAGVQVIAIIIPVR